MPGAAMRNQNPLDKYLNDLGDVDSLFVASDRFEDVLDALGARIVGTQRPKVGS
jgi:hypothetical protein